MSEISEIMWITMSPHIKLILDKVCDDIEKDPKYKVKKYFEDGVVVGVCIFHDENGVRWLDDAHYIGTEDKYIALKMWKFASFGAKIFKARVHKTNEKIWKLYLRIGFNIIEEDKFYYILQRGD